MPEGPQVDTCGLQGAQDLIEEERRNDLDGTSRSGPPWGRTSMEANQAEGSRAEMQRLPAGTRTGAKGCECLFPFPEGSETLCLAGGFKLIAKG